MWAHLWISCGLHADMLCSQGYAKPDFKFRRPFHASASRAEVYNRHIHGLFRNEELILRVLLQIVKIGEKKN